MIESIYTSGQYLENNPTWHAEDSPWKALKFKDILSRNNVHFNKVAEVGCGAGGILAAMAIHYPKASFEGYDISVQALELAKQKATTNIAFFHGDILKTAVNYDLIIAADVFEHVEDYMGFLRNLQKKASYKVYNIPLDINLNTLLSSGLTKQRKQVGHLHYFTAETALATLKDTGHQIIDYNYALIYADGYKYRDNTPLKRIVRLFRMLTYKVSKKWAARIFGAVSLVVLTK